MVPQLQAGAEFGHHVRNATYVDASSMPSVIDGSTASVKNKTRIRRKASAYVKPKSMYGSEGRKNPPAMRQCEQKNRFLLFLKIYSTKNAKKMGVWMLMIIISCSYSAPLLVCWL